MARRSEHPFFFIQESAKVWVSDASFLGGEPNENEKGFIIQRYVLPLPEGKLDNPFAFPLYMVRDSEGKDRAADKAVWDEMLIRRLLSGGDFYYQLQDSNPTESYCEELIDFHYDKLSTSSKYDFLPYLRQLLKREQIHIKERLSAVLSGSDIYNELRGAYNLQLKMVRCSLDWIKEKQDEIKDARSKDQTEQNEWVRVNGKITTLAHLILILSGRTRLDSRAGRSAQQGYIISQNGLAPETVKKYLKTAPTSGKITNLIYTKDNLVYALDYIDTLIEGLDRSTLKMPPELKSMV